MGKEARASGGPAFFPKKAGRKKGSGRGISISPAPTPHPLKRPIRGACGPPYWMYPPEGHLLHLAGAAGPLRSKAPPPGDWQENSLGEIPKMGEPQFPLFGRFKEGCKGFERLKTYLWHVLAQKQFKRSHLNPWKSKSLPCRLFPPFRRRKGGARRAGVPWKTERPAASRSRSFFIIPRPA